MQLRPLASVTVNLKPPVMVGPGPFGVRVFIEVCDGVIESDAEAIGLRPFTGKVLPGGGDWALLGADGWCRLDVRILHRSTVRIQRRPQRCATLRKTQLDQPRRQRRDGGDLGR